LLLLISCDEKDCCRVVSVGQLGFDCRLYCGRSRSMQDNGSKTDEPTPLVRDAKENREKKMAARNPVVRATRNSNSWA